MHKKTKSLLIGYGNMGSSFIHPLRKMCRWTVVDRSKRPSFECDHLTSVSELDGDFDFIVMAVKPHQLKEVLELLDRKSLNPRTRIISLIAGAKTNFFRQILGDEVRVSLAMSNLPVKVGKGVTAVFSDERLDFLDQLGQTIYVSEEGEIGTFF